MNKSKIYYMQTEGVDVGNLQVTVRTDAGFVPVENATVTITDASDPENIIEQVKTDASGQTPVIELKTPPLDYSMAPDQPQPFANYNILVESEGYQNISISGTEVFAENNAIQNVTVRELRDGAEELRSIAIPYNTLFGDFPPKIAEAEIKPISESGEIVLSRVVIPEYVIVHDGPPTDSSASNYYVKYRDYIKNVASSEIYSTWPDNTIRANVLAIMSFTLNRVYTEWYRNKGYDFTITSSTAFDHKFVYGRNIFENISVIVDEIFSNYLSRPNVKQPILTQYCDGHKVTCPNWMTQWGSKELGDQNYETIEIIRYFYGSDMFINTAEEISGVPSSWPGSDLSFGSSGDKVRQMQEQLARISRTYSAIPVVLADGRYGPVTQEAVETFQKIFNLPVTGVVDFKTWYKISEVYVGVTRIAELV